MNQQQNTTIRLLRVLRYNKARIERAIELLAPEKQKIFHIIPFLLHINHRDFPGFLEDLNTPKGLSNYSLRQEVVEALRTCFPQSKALNDLKKIWPKHRLIESLVLMGSIGTIAQSRISDFDYWVCIDGSRYTQATINLLHRKLNLIEQWADTQHGMEVHFFLSQIDKVRGNDFGITDGESSGSAQAIFLKAEFYTTHIVVAGKLPLWWLMPDMTTDEEYLAVVDTLKASEAPDAKWFMDLGNVAKLDANELFGAAIWQINKAMDSPFKSVLKMAKLEVFLENIDHKQPLCDVLKSKVHHSVNAPGNLEHIDPYGLMFDGLISHYSRVKNSNVLQLLQLCLYIQSGCRLSLSAEQVRSNFKRKIIASYVKSWGWSQKKIEKVDRMKDWDFRELSLLSRQMHSFLINCYRRMSARLPPGKQLVSKEDMTVLGRKLDTFYSKKDNKVHYLRSVFDNELYCKTVTINIEAQRNGERLWSMYAGDQLKGQDSALKKVHLLSSNQPIDLIVWGIANRILDKKTKILLDSKGGSVTEDDFYTLLVLTEQLFPPVRVSEIPRKALLAPAKILNCMVVINFESRRIKVDIETVRIVYSDTWGELYSRSGFKALAALRVALLDVKPLPGTYLLALEGSHKKRLYRHFFELSGLEFKQKL
ncbi:MAG: adenylate cyclase class 1 [Paraglaciecola sp.]|jgi:adenylate cyclase class 1